MTKEEKRKLVLKDLSSRLPYNVWVEYKGEHYVVTGIVHERLSLLTSPVSSIGFDEHPLIEEVKPCLFPISSMTSEQLFEVSQIIDKDVVEIRESFLDIIDSGCHIITYLEILELLEWFYKNHFDICDLIPKGLAKDATKLKISNLIKN